MVIAPRLVISAPASGCGKTTVATGLMAALCTRGVVVSGHKVGPDYIDPGYHALATGRPGRNLDPFLCGEELIGPLFAHGAAGADIAVIEGVMGLFDGAADPAMAGQHAGPDFASTAHVARLLRAPVVLVVDASAVGRSVAALVAGFAGFDPRVRIAGVIFNRVGSARHERLLRDAVEPAGTAVFGAIRRTDAVVTPSRHLGLVPAAERRAAAGRAIALLGDLVASSCDLAGLRALAATAPPLAAPPWDPRAALDAATAATSAASGPGQVSGLCHFSSTPGQALVRSRSGGSGQSGGSGRSGGSGTIGGIGPSRRSGAGPLIAVAQGPAFTFSYAEHAELLEAAGARIAPFDPLADEALPAGTAGLIIGGGFPEMYAPELSANARLRRQVAALAAAGVPVVAECAGLLYLARTLDGLPMCGVIEADTHMTQRLRLGYRTAVAMSDSVLAHVGHEVRGHEFHRTAAALVSGGRPAWRLTGRPPAAGAAAGGLRTDGHVHGNVLASYLHLHWAHTPIFARRFAAACAQRPPAPAGAAANGTVVGDGSTDTATISNIATASGVAAGEAAS